MNTEVNTDNVALTQRLSSKTTKNYYTGGTFPAIPSREEFHRYASNILNYMPLRLIILHFLVVILMLQLLLLDGQRVIIRIREININLNQLKILLRKIINNVRW